MTLEAVNLRGNLYAVRPIGKLGTCGWIPDTTSRPAVRQGLTPTLPGSFWTVDYVHATSAAAAVRKSISKK